MKTCGAKAEAWKDTRVQAYGWINPGFNLSTSKHSNLPEGYNILPNRLDLDQAVIYVERVPDTVQTDHIDWGFRAGEMFGIDYHLLSVHSDNSEWTGRAKKVLESTGAEDISSTGEAKADIQKTDKPMPRAS